MRFILMLVTVGILLSMLCCEKTTEPATPAGEMVYVEGGNVYYFQYLATLSPFYIDKCEVTQHDYQAVMGNNPASLFGTGRNFPVYNVSWFDAIAYCNKRSLKENLSPCYTFTNFGTDPSNWPSGWNEGDSHINIVCCWIANGYRLPTEAEWERAHSYSGNDSLGAVGWYRDNSGGRAHKVATRLYNDLGVYDMTGNVREWCWDIYTDQYTGTALNPHGADNGNYRMLLGGSWNEDSGMCMGGTRFYSLPVENLNMNGFRVCRTAM